jgi:type IV pilus assembly protein PilA
MLIKLNNNDPKGFTLIELMIVIAIIGILAAIAIPQFSAYRIRSCNSAAQSDLRNLAVAQEGYFVNENTYSSDVTTLSLAPYGFTQSKSVTVGAVGSTGGYTISSFHAGGNKTYSLAGPGGTIGP